MFIGDVRLTIISDGVQVNKGGHESLVQNVDKDVPLLAED